MGYWEEEVEDERECGGCGYTVTMTRREYYEEYGFEPGGRNPGYERGIVLPRIPLAWTQDGNIFTAVYKKYFTVNFEYYDDYDDPYFIGGLYYYEPEYEDMIYKDLCSNEIKSVEDVKKYIEERLADKKLSAEMTACAVAYAQKEGLPCDVFSEVMPQTVTSDYGEPRFLDLS